MTEEVVTDITEMVVVLKDVMAKNMKTEIIDLVNK